MNFDHLPIDPHAYVSFLLIMAGMAATPGPANLFALATGLAHGPRAGLWGVFGMNVASLVWFVFAALGLGVLMQLYPTVFSMLAILGGLYLAWLGFKALRSALSKETQGFKLTGHAAGSNPFKDGFLVQISNPKALLFFTAVLPPFIDPQRDTVPQLAMFAAGTILFDTITMSMFALAGGLMAQQFAQARFARLFSGAVGILLLSTATMMLLRTAH
ncbi:LysE family translocator [Aquidulcibacter paucihalophilus]|uniref:LysE family translocator n=1 Tax=Aquidulcibacter paucihalophilus TaxID=1978549 RepID=UPI000A18DB25|nr:LysE family translocator [Aquidulcibacter paucihalophilus]